MLHHAGDALARLRKSSTFRNSFGMSTFSERRVSRSNGDKQLGKRFISADCHSQGPRRKSKILLPVRSAIDRLRTTIQLENDDAVRNFLSTEKGFRLEQVWKSFLRRCTLRFFIVSFSSSPACLPFTTSREESSRPRGKPNFPFVMPRENPNQA